MPKQNIPNKLHGDDRDSISYLQSLHDDVQTLQDAVEEIQGGTGAIAFTSLSDTPQSYSGQAGKALRVNSGESAVEFVNTTFTSTDHAITSSGTWTEAHGLGAAPPKLWGYLVCQTGEYGYSVGEVLAVPLGGGVYTEGGTSTNLHSYGVSVTVDATNITVYYANETTAVGSTVFLHLRRDTGVLAFLTDANWKFRVVAAL